MVFKRSQHVGPNNVASCWPTMLRAFARALTLIYNRGWKLNNESKAIMNNEQPTRTCKNSELLEEIPKE